MSYLARFLEKSTETPSADPTEPTKPGRDTLESSADLPGRPYETYETPSLSAIPTDWPAIVARLRAQAGPSLSLIDDPADPVFGRA